MATNIKPITFWGSVLGPNPGKVYMILKELESHLKKTRSRSLRSKDPNTLNTTRTDGFRQSTIQILTSPSGNLVLSLYVENFEHDQLISNLAIQEYLVDKYDKEHKLSFLAGTNEYYLTKQWMYFQVSGQGPYYGQAWYISFLPLACR